MLKTQQPTLQIQTPAIKHRPKYLLLLRQRTRSAFRTRPESNELFCRYINLKIARGVMSGTLSEVEIEEGLPNHDHPAKRQKSGEGVQASTLRPEQLIPVARQPVALKSVLKGELSVPLSPPPLVYSMTWRSLRGLLNHLMHLYVFNGNQSVLQYHHSHLATRPCIFESVILIEPCPSNAVYTVRADPNYAQPWQMRPQRR